MTAKELLMPTVRRLLTMAGPTVVDAGISEENDFAKSTRRQVQLHVKHLLWEGDTTPEIAKANLHKICKALLIRQPTAKERKVERRLMLARGEQARKAKARKTHGRKP
jgi:hypothetical protein